MNPENIELNTQLGKIFKREEWQQIIKAIVTGKYSWACVLILHFAGYNPIDYIPYRTYMRLLKNNYRLGNVNLQESDNQQLNISGIESTWVKLGNRKHG
jgi:hypothetical protein